MLPNYIARRPIDIPFVPMELVQFYKILLGSETPYSNQARVNINVILSLLI